MHDSWRLLSLLSRLRRHERSVPARMLQLYRSIDNNTSHIKKNTLPQGYTGIRLPDITLLIGSKDDCPTLVCREFPSDNEPLTTLTLTLTCKTLRRAPCPVLPLHRLHCFNQEAARDNCLWSTQHDSCASLRYTGIQSKRPKR